MSDVAELTCELLERVNDDVRDRKREMVSVPQRLSSLERYHATMTGDLGQIRTELDDMRGDISQIKRRLELALA